MPNDDNGAGIERRELPKGANCPTAQDNNGGAPSAVAVVVAVWHLALLGSLRLWQFALLGS